MGVGGATAVVVVAGSINSYGIVERWLSHNHDKGGGDGNLGQWGGGRDAMTLNSGSDRVA